MSPKLDVKQLKIPSVLGDSLDAPCEGHPIQCPKVVIDVNSSSLWQRFELKAAVDGQLADVTSDVRPGERQ